LFFIKKVKIEKKFGNIKGSEACIAWDTRSWARSSTSIQEGPDQHGLSNG
jgi:hypothetical protein